MVPTAIQHPRFLSEEAFIRRLHLEQRRTERSHRPFVFVLLEAKKIPKSGEKQGLAEQIRDLLLLSFRETDIKGWYQDGASIGLIFTEIGDGEGQSIGKLLIEKIRQLLACKLSSPQAPQVDLSFYVFPEDWDKGDASSKAVLYPDAERSRRPSQFAKRCVDIAGSLTALILASPVFIAVAVAVKVTSKGPILFRQKRVGRYGRQFTFLKFRSMYVNNDHAVHREYVKNLIAGSATSSDNGDAEQKVFKLTNDPRITRVGRFLRKTSLDEIPQFLNVLKGEMSLVGPRPPIPYEVESYEIWHRRRLLGVKPGITGLWQVNGRSRTTFDEMVRLDLQYAKSWSVWMDLKILFQTPRAVVAGDGAY